MNTFYSHFINKASALRLASMLSLMVIFFAVGVGAAYGQTIYVSGQSGDDDINNGTSTLDAYQTIQKAVDNATSGSVIAIEAYDYPGNGFGESTTIDKTLTFQLLTNADDTLRVNDLRVNGTFALTVERGSGSSGVVLLVEDSLQLGAADSDSVSLVVDAADAGAVAFKENATFSMNGDTVIVSGANLTYLDKVNISYNVGDVEFTAGDELPSSLNEGILSVTADSTFDFGKDVTAGAIRIFTNDGDNGTIIRDEGRTVTIAGSTADSSFIKEKSAFDLVIGDKDERALVILNDTLEGNFTVSELMEDSVIFRNTSTDTSQITGNLTIGSNSIAVFDFAKSLSLLGNLTNNGGIIDVSPDGGQTTGSVTSEIIFEGSSAQTFTTGIGVDTLGGITIADGSSLTIDDEIVLASTDTALRVLGSGSLSIGDNIVYITGSEAHVKNAGTSTGEIYFKSDSATIAGLGYNNITIDSDTVGSNSGGRSGLFVNPNSNDSTTFGGRLKITKGILVIQNAGLNPTNETTAQELVLFPGNTEGFSLISGSGTFNNEENPLNLTYDGTIDTNYTIGSEWSDYIQDLTISTESVGEADSLVFPTNTAGSKLRVAGTFNIDSTANNTTPLVGQAGDLGQGVNDTLFVSGTFGVDLVNTSKQYSISSRGDTLFVDITGSGAHTLGARFDSSNVVVNLNGGSTFISNVDSSNATFVVQSNITSFDFSDAGKFNGRFEVSGGVIATGVKFPSVFRDSVVLGELASVTLADSLTISGGAIVADTGATFDRGVYSVIFDEDGTGDENSFFGAPNVTLDGSGNGSYRFQSNGKINGNRATITGVEFGSSSADSIVVASDLTVDGDVRVSSPVWLKDTLSVSGDLDLRSSIYNDPTGTGLADTRLQLGATTISLVNSDTLNSANVNGAVSLSGTSVRSLYITDTLKLSSGSLDIDNDSLVFIGAGTNRSGVLDNRLSASASIAADGGIIAFGGNVSNVESNFIIDDNDGSDTLTVTNLTLQGTDSLSVDSANVLVTGTLRLGASGGTDDLILSDGSLTMDAGAEIIIADTASRIDTTGRGTFAADNNLIVRYQDGSIGKADSSALELINGTVAVLDINMASGDTLTLVKDLVVTDSLVLNAGVLHRDSTNGVFNTLTLGTGSVYRNASQTDRFTGIFTASGAYTVNLGNTYQLSDSIVVRNDVDLNVDAGAFTVSYFRSSNTDTSFTFNDFNLSTNNVFDLGSDTLTVTGDLNTGTTGNFDASSGKLIFAGSDDAQDLTTSATFAADDITVNNTNGVHLKGGNAISVDTLTLSNGDFDLGGSVLTLLQGETYQGYTGADSTSYVSNGYIKKSIPGGDSDSLNAVRNYVSFPLGVQDTNYYRPLDIWFNTDPIDDITVTVGHFNSDPEGTVFSTDAENAGVDKYPDFYWTVETSQSLAGSYAYQLDMEAKGYELLADQDVDDIKVIHRAAGDKTTNEWRLLSTTYDNSINGDNVPIVSATAATGGLSSNQRFFTFGLGADVVYSDTLPTFQLTEGGREGLDTLNVADLDTVFESSSSLTFSVDTGTVNARIDADNVLAVFADTMSQLTESYTDSITITATDGFNPISVLLQVQVNPSPFVKSGADLSYTLTADSVTGNTADISGNPKKIALTDIFGGGSDSLFYQIIDTSTYTYDNGAKFGFFEDDSDNLGKKPATDFIDVEDDDDRLTGTYAQALDDTLRIYVAADTVFDSGISNAIGIRVTDGQIFEDDTVFISFETVQAQTLVDTVKAFDLTINGSDTTIVLNSTDIFKYDGGFGDLSYTMFPSSGDTGAVILDTTNTTISSYTFTPSDDSTGTVTYTYRATDENGVTNEATFTVTTLDSVLFDSPLADLSLTAAPGVDSDSVIYSLDSLVTGGDSNFTWTSAFTKEKVASASISEDTLTITPLDSGVTNLILTATDGNGGFAHDTVQITVTGTTYRASFDSALSEIAADTVLLEGEEFSFQYAASSPDSADVIYKFAGVTPSGASLDSTTGLLTWTPTSYGEYSIRVTAFNADYRNDADYSSTDDATVTVINAPTFTAELGDTSVATGDTLEFTFVADVYEGGTVSSFTLDSTYNDSASITSAGKFQFIPGVTYNGDYDFTVTVTDDKGASATSSFTVNVTQSQPWGDVDGTGVVSAFDATGVLRHVVGLDTLSDTGKVLADVSGNGSVSSLDASLILRKVADRDYDFPVEREGNLKAVPATGEFTLSNMSGASEDELAMNLSINQTKGVNALTVTINYDAGLNELTAIESALPEGWMFFYNDVQEEGVIKISAAGSSELTDRDNLITLRFNTMNVEMPSSVNADVTMNEEATSPLADVLLQAIPSEFALNQNYPNPFNPTTNIKFALPQSSVVKLEVFNVLGQRVATLVNGEMNAGYHTVMFDASNLASGVYVYRINTGEHMQVKRMMLIK